MPRLTCSASLRRCALQGASSDQVLQMPMIGRPSNAWSGMPWVFIQLRCMKPFLSALPNHSVARRLRCGGVDAVVLYQCGVQEAVLVGVAKPCGGAELALRGGHGGQEGKVGGKGLV